MKFTVHKREFTNTQIHLQHITYYFENNSTMKNNTIKYMNHNENLKNVNECITFSKIKVRVWRNITGWGHSKIFSPNEGFVVKVNVSKVSLTV